MHHHGKFHQNKLSGCGDIAIFPFVKMAAVTILDFKILEILSAGNIQRAEMHHHAKCCKNRSNGY